MNGAAGNFLCAPEDLSANGFKTGEQYLSFIFPPLLNIYNSNFIFSFSFFLFIVMEIDAIGTFHMSKAAFESLKATTGKEADRGGGERGVSREGGRVVS